MLPIQIKMEISFKDENEIKEWLARFTIPIDRVLSLYGNSLWFLNPKVREDFLDSKKLKTKQAFIESLANAPFIANKSLSISYGITTKAIIPFIATIDISDQLELNIVELYLKLYNSEIRKIYKGRVPFNISPNSILTGITHTRRVLAVLANIQGSSVHTENYSVHALKTQVPSMFRIIVTEPKKCINVLEDLNSIKAITFKPLFVNKQDNETSNVQGEDMIIKNIKINWPGKVDTSYPSLNRKETYKFLKMLSEKHPDCIIKSLNNDMSKDIRLYVASQNNQTSTNIMIGPLVHDELQVHFLITVGHVFSTSYIQSLIDSCIRKAYSLSVRIEGVADAQLIQLQLYEMQRDLESRKLSFPKSFMFLRDHLAVILGSKSVWTDPASSLGISSPSYNNLVYYDIQVTPNNLILEYTITGLTSEDVHLFKKHTLSRPSEDILKFIQPGVNINLSSNIIFNIK